MSVRRFHKPRGKLNVRGKQETVISSRGMLKLRLHNRFIHVGVDISSYALHTGGRSSHPPVLVKLIYPRSLVYKWSKYICIIVILDYPRHGYVLYGSRIIKICVYTIYNCRAEVPAPIHDHLTITWLEVN